MKRPVRIQYFKPNSGKVGHFKPNDQDMEKVLASHPEFPLSYGYNNCLFFSVRVALKAEGKNYGDDH